MKAWIETPDGKKIPVEANCFFGRSQNSTVLLNSGGASRRHAHIHAQQADRRLEYWLADLGSTNGTLCNGKRVTIPCRLRDRDVLSFAGEQFVFRLDHETAAPFAYTEAAPTMPVRALQTCWLLMLDIKHYTRLSTQLETNALAHLVGTWLRNVRDAIEGHGGVVDKFLGDAIFAYWLDQPSTASAVTTALERLRALQGARSPDFRIVVHHGGCIVSGGAGGADNLSGPNVICVFRMEKVSSAQRTDTIFSRAAAQALGPLLPLERLGEFPLDGFDGRHELFQISPAEPHDLPTDSDATTG